ncbi:MAG: SpoVG [Pseudomonadota bacterium]
MKIAIEHHNDQFNVLLSSKEGAEPFLTIKGCRIVNGRNGPFVSWPARKLESGKYWNHVYASEAFGAAVIAAAGGAPEPAPPPRPAPPPAPKRGTAFDDMDNDPPF